MLNCGLDSILLTWLDCKVGTRPLLMTHPTRAIAPIILQDYLQIRCHGSRVCSCMSCTCRICQSNLQCLFVWKCLKASIVSMVSRTSCMSRGFVFHFSLFLNYLNLWLQDVSAGGCEKTKSKAKEIAESLSAKTTKMCQVCPGIEPGRSGASLVISPLFWRLLTTSKTAPKLFKTLIVIGN